MFIKHCIIILSALSFTCSTICVKAQDWIVYNMSNSGLPDNQVQAIAIDKKGVKWIGTANGLASYDGKNWSTYKKENSPLPSSMVRALAIDGDENVWIGTDKGLAVFDRNHWTVYNSTNSILTNDAITTIVYDKKGNDTWIGTEKGLVKYDGTHWMRFDDNNSALIDDHIYSIAIDQQNIVWVGTFDHFQFAGRLNRFDGHRWEVTRLEHKELNSSFPQALIVDKNDALWMGVNGTMGGLLVGIDGNSWQIVNDPGAKEIPGGVHALVIEGNEKWVGNGGGLTVYNGASFKTFNSKNSALPDNFVYTIAVDQKGNKWIGTIYGGVAVYNGGGVVNDSIGQLDPTFSIYPNPVKSAASIFYTIKKKEKVTITMYSADGRAIEILQDKIVEKGNYRLSWNTAAFPAGIYLCTLKSGKKIYTKKIFKY